MKGLPSSSHFPTATPQLVGGQASLSRGSRSGPVQRTRALTGDLDLQIVAPPALSGRIGPAGYAVPDGPNAPIRGNSELPGIDGSLGEAQASERPPAHAERAVLASARPDFSQQSSKSGGADSPVSTHTSKCLGGADGLRNLSLHKALEDATARIGRVRRTDGESQVNVRENSARRVARVRAMSRVLTRSADGGPSLPSAVSARSAFE